MAWKTQKARGYKADIIFYIALLSPWAIIPKWCIKKGIFDFSLIDLDDDWYGATKHLLPNATLPFEEVWK